MTQRNSLMEWLDQTKKLSKSMDYSCLDLIDDILETIQFINKRTISKHRSMITGLCEKYHKPDPFNFIQTKKIDLKDPHIISVNRLIDNSLKRFQEKNKEIVWQWFEIIDFMYERPELVNPIMIDEYVKGVIDGVCKKYRKNNPFNDGHHKLFGKYWKDEKGQLHKERRNRF